MINEKIGSFIATMRRERGMTQEQLAEKLGVTNRSVSRWENGKTLPDLSLMQSLCEELNVSISELLNGEKEAADMEIEDTVRVMAALTDKERARKARELNQYLIPGLFLLPVVVLHDWLSIMGIVEKSMELPLRIGLVGLGMALQLIGIWRNNRDHALTDPELEVLFRKETDVRMKTAGEMIQFARKYQKWELKQQRHAFEAIARAMAEDEFAVFSMTGSAYQFDNHPGPWHIALAVTNKRVLLCGEFMRGRLLTTYTPEWLEREEIESVNYTGGRILIGSEKNMLKIEGDDLVYIAEKLKTILEK